MKIMALDLAAQTGFAVGRPCSQPIFGHVRLRGKKAGERLLFLLNFLRDQHKEHQFDLVVFEEQYIGGKMAPSAALTLYGYRAIPLAFCAMRGVQDAQQSPSSVRKHFIGNGGLGRDAAKKFVMDECARRGWKVDNDDEADALALWDFQCTKEDPQHLVWGMSVRK